MKILVVEDEASVRDFLSQALREAGYEVETAGDGESGLKLGQSAAPDLILLDVMLPRLDGFTVCRRLRERGIGVPILILTARDDIEDKIEGLDAGADDYIVKPFVVAELLARARALLRRASANALAVLTVGDLILDPATRKARRGGKTIELSATEYALLELLLKNAGRVVSRADLLQGVWQYDFGGQDNVLEVYISYLRRKIDRPFASPLIHTVRGAGYRVGTD